MTDTQTAAAPAVPELNNSEHVHRARATYDAARAAQQGAFLAAFMKLPMVSKASEAAGIGRTTHYEWLKHDEDYARLFDEAKRIGYQELKDSAVEAVLHGWEERTVENGQTTRVVTRRSERLMIELLRMAFPQEFKNIIAHAGADGVSPMEVEISAREQFLSALAGLTAGTGAEQQTQAAQ